MNLRCPPNRSNFLLTQREAEPCSDSRESESRTSFSAFGRNTRAASVPKCPQKFTLFAIERREGDSASPHFASIVV